MFYFGSVFYHCESLSFHLVLLDKVNHLRKTPLTFFMISMIFLRPNDDSMFDLLYVKSLFRFSVL